MLRKVAIDRFVCPCSRPVLPEVDSLAGSFALAVDPSYRKSIRLWAMREGRLNVDDSTRFDSNRSVCLCSRPVLPEVDSLAGYEGGQKMLTIRLDST